MIERQGARLHVTVPMTMANARGLLDAGRSVFKDGEAVVDLGAVVEADSSALAVLFGWLRLAQGGGFRLAITNMPAGVRSLAELYGVIGLLPLV